jgi:hypothetical protein
VSHAYIHCELSFNTHHTQRISAAVVRYDAQNIREQSAQPIWRALLLDADAGAALAGARVLDVHFRPAGPALCCVASTRVCPVRRTHTFTDVNFYALRETDGTWDNGYTHACLDSALRFVRPSGHVGSCITRPPAL